MSRTWEIESPTAEEVGGAADPVRSVSVTLVAGRVDVVADGAGGAARYEVHEVGGLPLRATWNNGQFKLEHYKDPRGQIMETVKSLFAGRLNPHARVTLTVPPGTAVTLNTVSADVLVAGITGTVSINTVSGATSLARLSGRIDVKTVSSNVDVSHVAGDLRSKTVSGSLTVDESPLRSAKIATVSGATIVDLATTNSLITANAVSGDLTIRIPGAGGYDVTASSTSGHVVVDGQTLSGGSAGDKGGHRSEGDRGVAVKARTVSGNVVVLRGTQGPGMPTVEPGQNRADVQDVRPSRRADDGEA